MLRGLAMNDSAGQKRGPHDLSPAGCSSVSKQRSAVARRALPLTITSLSDFIHIGIEAYSES